MINFKFTIWILINKLIDAKSKFQMDNSSAHLKDTSSNMGAKNLMPLPEVKAMTLSPKITGSATGMLNFFIISKNNFQKFIKNI